LNNLLQGFHFDAVMLANIAAELDNEEGRLLGGSHVIEDTISQLLHNLKFILCAVAA